MEDQDDEAEKAEDMNDAPLISEGLKRKKTLDDLEEDEEEEEEESISGRSSMMAKRETEITNNGSFTEDSPNTKEEVFVDPKKNSSLWRQRYRTLLTLRSQAEMGRRRSLTEKRPSALSSLRPSLTMMSSTNL